MKNGKLWLIFGGVVLLVGGGLYFVDSSLFKGSMERPEGSRTDDSREPKEIVGEKWWCKKIEESKWKEEEEPGDEKVKDPASGSERNVDRKPPEGQMGNSGSGSGSSGSPGGSEFFGRFNPKNQKIEINNDYGDLFIDLAAPKNIWLRYRDVPIVAGSGSGSGGSKRGGGGGPKGVPEKVVVEHYHECSCNASNFTIPDLPDKIFWCPDPGEKIEFTDLIDKKGIKHKVIAYTPQEGACQEEKKENETIFMLGFCGCDETFYSVELDQTLDCPDYGDSMQIEVYKDYYINLYKSSEYKCEPKWQCPDGYDIDWDVVDNACNEEKKKVCGLESSTIENGAKICEVLKPWGTSLNDVECPSFEDCKGSVDIVLSGVGTSEIVEKGLADPWNCQDLYGDVNSGVWE